MCNFICLEYFRSPIFQEVAEKKEMSNVYESVYASLEKNYSADWFYKMVELSNEYTDNRDKYPTLKQFFPKYIDCINSISFEQE